MTSGPPTVGAICEQDRGNHHYLIALVYNTIARQDSGPGEILPGIITDSHRSVAPLLRCTYYVSMQLNSIYSTLANLEACTDFTMIST